jgi:hypothetical protein
MPKEQRKPTGNIPQSILGGRDEMIKASISLQDLRKRIYIIGWNRWSREWLHRDLGLYGDYGIRYLPKAVPVR